MAESRTAKSVKNAKVAMLFFACNLIITFISRKVFIYHLGSELLGLNTTVVNLLNFLNLAELGIGGAISFTLYKPLYEHNYKEINDIVSLQGYLYRKIAYVVIASSAVLMCFFPLIFAKAKVTTWFPYATFIVMLFSALLGYFANYRQIVFSADQKEYRNKIVIQGITQVKLIVQIAAVVYLSNGYIYWLLLELISSVCIAYFLNVSIKRHYPWLKPDVSKGKQLKEKHSIILTKTKQLFFHKIGGFVLGQTTPLVIYTYLSLTVVAIYGNYQLITMGITSLITSVFNSVGAGVGNLVAEGNKKKIITVFWEIQASRYWVASILCFSFYILSTPFMKLWMGENYLIDNTSLLLMVIIAFIMLTRTAVESFLAAYGLFQDVYAPIIEAFLNITFSVVLGYYWGLSGILSGVLISLIVVIVIWKPLFLYSRGFKQPSHWYFINLLKLLVIALFPMLFVIHVFPFNSEISIASVCLYGIKSIGLYFLLYTIFFYILSKELKCFILRVVTIIKS